MELMIWLMELMIWLMGLIFELISGINVAIFKSNYFTQVSYAYKIIIFF